MDAGALAARLKAELDDAMAARKMVETRWLDDLRQYRGQYPEDVRERLRRHKRSQVYYRLTTQKVNTLVARLMDLLFPQKSKNWGIDPTPDPLLPEDVIMAELGEELAAGMQEIMGAKLAELQARNIIPDMWAVQRLQADALRQAYAKLDTRPVRIRIAKKRAAAMEQVIADQLLEGSANGQRRPSWQQNCRSVVKDACLYGMGVLKGPLIEKTETRRYQPVRDAFGRVNWQERVVSATLRPYHEAVSVWDVFPDPGARLPGELRFVWQLHLMSDKDVRELARFPGFKAEAVRKHLREFAEGDAQLAEWEVQTRAINEDNLSRGERPQEPLSRLRAVGVSDRSGIARFRGGTAGGRRRQGVFRQCLAVGRHADQGHGQSSGRRGYSLLFLSVSVRRHGFLAGGHRFPAARPASGRQCRRAGHAGQRGGQFRTYARREHRSGVPGRGGAELHRTQSGSVQFLEQRER